MQRSVLALAFLALSGLACTSGRGGFLSTTTLVPSPFAPTATDTPTSEPPSPVPTLVPVVVELPTSTPVRLGPGNGANPGLPTASSLQGVGVSPANQTGNGAFSAQNVPIAGSMLQLPAANSLIPIDFDVTRSGHTAVIDPSGTMTLDGGAFNGYGKLVNKHYMQVRWSPDGRWLAF